MKNAAIFITLLFIVFPALADAGYYIELSDEASQEEALNKWQRLVRDHKEALAQLQVYPVIVVRPDHTIVNRLHAGPIATKAAAEKICKMLFVKNQPCFVLEGVDYPRSAALSGSVPVQQNVPNSALPWSSPPAQEDVPSRWW